MLGGRAYRTVCLLLHYVRVPKAAAVLKLYSDWFKGFKRLLGQSQKRGFPKAATTLIKRIQNNE
jgi:hypothetical protein